MFPRKGILGMDKCLSRVCFLLPFNPKCFVHPFYWESSYLQDETVSCCCCLFSPSSERSVTPVPRRCWVHVRWGEKHAECSAWPLSQPVVRTQWQSGEERLWWQMLLLCADWEFGVPFCVLTSRKSRTFRVPGFFIYKIIEIECEHPSILEH